MGFEEYIKPDENFLRVLKHNREGAKRKIVEIYDKWFKGAITNPSLVREYYQFRSLYYSNQDFPPETNERVKRKRQASLEMVREIDRIIEAGIKNLDITPYLFRKVA